LNKQTQTEKSFDFQWKNLPEGKDLLSDQNWRDNVEDYILDELEMTREEIKGKKVLDAGCGNGRWSYGFMKLKTEIYGFDISPSAVNYAGMHIPNVSFKTMNILNIEGLLEYYGEKFFDILWCWGVLHHTDLKKGFENISKLVKKGGLLHIYVYGKKSFVNRSLRRIFNWFSFKNRVRLAKLLSKFNGSSVHSNFDAFSPPIATNHTVDEMFELFYENGFQNVYRFVPRRALKSTDLFMTGEKI